MTEDRSLDEFLREKAPTDGRSGSPAGEGATEDGSGDADGAGSADGEAREDDQNSETPSTEDTPNRNGTRAVSTSTWMAEGDTCERCTRDVRRRWRHDDLFVCGRCVEW